jgi:Zn-dependent metalloprotease
MKKNLQHWKETTKTFNIQKQEQKPSTFLKVKIRTFNLQEQKQKPSASKNRKKTFNLFKRKSKNFQPSR